MEVNVTYEERKLSFISGTTKGKDLDELISYIGKNKKSIDKVNITGESNSYTFLRQIYLFANMTAALSGIEVCINSRKVSASRPAFPTYH